MALCECFGLSPSLLLTLYASEYRLKLFHLYFISTLEIPSSHLNDHVRLQKHGNKREPHGEFLKRPYARRDPRVHHPQYSFPCLTPRPQNSRRLDVFGDRNANRGVSARMHSRRDTHIQYLLPHPSLNLVPNRTILLLPAPFLPRPQHRRHHFLPHQSLWFIHPNLRYGPPPGDPVGTRLKAEFTIDITRTPSRRQRMPKTPRGRCLVGRHRSVAD